MPNYGGYPGGGPNGIGGAVGGIFGVGGPGGSAADQLNSMGIAGPAQPNLTAEQQAAAQQQQLLAILTGKAAGTGPSAAQAQLQAGVQAAGANQAAVAAGGRYGQNASLRQQQVANTTAGIEGAGANAAAGLKANEMNAGAAEAAPVGAALASEGLQGAALGEQGQLAYNQQVAGLGAAEEAQSSAASSTLMQDAAGLPGQAVSGATKLASMSATASASAHGGAFDRPRDGLDLTGEAGPDHDIDLTGEAGPEAILGLRSGKAKLADRPNLAKLGIKEPQVVIPLKDGTADYKGGPMPTKVGRGPTKPLPRGAEPDPSKLSPEAKAAIARLLGEVRGSHAMAGGGVAGRSPMLTILVGG